MTAAKAVLGKMLFWDEQLSSDNTMACGSCHQPRHGGGARRLLCHPGFDGQLRTRDDGFGATGILRAGKDDTPEAQITRRQSLAFFMSQHAPSLFWDGRASGTFRDPLTGKVVIQKGVMVSAAMPSWVLCPS